MYPNVAWELASTENNPWGTTTYIVGIIVAQGRPVTIAGEGLRQAVSPSVCSPVTTDSYYMLDSYWSPPVGANPPNVNNPTQFLFISPGTGPNPWTLYVSAGSTPPRAVFPYRVYFYSTDIGVWCADSEFGVPLDIG